MNGTPSGRPPAAGGAGTGRFLSAVFSSYRQAQEAAYKLLAVRAENIGIELADPSGTDGPKRFPAVRFGAGADVEFADEWPPYAGEYRLTADVPERAWKPAGRIIRDCGGRIM